MTDQYVVGLDLGGTFIKALVVDRDGEVQSRASLSTEADAGPDHVIRRMYLAVQQVCSAANVDPGEVLGVGVGTPGPLDLKRGQVVQSANLSGWERVPLRDHLAKLTGRRVSMTNDANAAAFGEYWRGAGREVRHLCLLTLGTGVGGGVIVDGELLHGHFDNAGELGHLIIDIQGPSCGCGQRGCLEAYAGGSYLARAARERAEDQPGSPLGAVLTGKGDIEVPDIISAAKAGDAAAAALWDRACRAIAVGCVNLQHAFNPERILLGGGISGAGEDVVGPVLGYFAELTWTQADDRPEICLAALGNDAGAIGAAGWFLHLHKQGRV